MCSSDLLNRAARRLIDRADERVIGQPIGKLLPSWPDLAAQPAPMTGVELAFHNGAMARSFDLRLSPLTDRVGREVGNVAVLHDITERKRMEAALLAQKQLFENLVAVARATTAHPTLAATLQDALDVAARLTGADQGSLFLCDPAGVVTHSILARGETVPEQRQALVRTVLDKGLAGWVIQHRQGALIDDIASDSRWFPLPNPPYTVCSALAVPILSGSTALGVLISAHSNYTRRGGQMKLCSVDSRIQNIFVITKLSYVFDTYPNEEQAIASFAESRSV